jgi:hypothetical protein
MHQRCEDPNHKSFARYGGRGISVCIRWSGEDGFANFLSDMGEKPVGMSIDRFPNRDGNYEPGNCRWTTATEQARNRSSSKLEAHEAEQIRWLCAEGFSKREVAKFFDLHPGTVFGIVAGTSRRQD